MNVAVTIKESDLIAIDPRPCGLCGLTIDRHIMIDDGEGPEFFCDDILIDDLTLDELERREELRREEDVAAIIARWEAIDRPARRDHAEPEPYRPAASTIDAFKFVARQGDVAALKAWLRDHRRDAPYLLDMLESQDHAD